MNTLLSIAEAARLIKSGATLAVAGSVRALDSLPEGNWIGGTSYYFVGPDGAVKTNEQVFVTDIGLFGAVNLAVYGRDELDGLTRDAPGHGFTLAIIPAATESLRRFAQRPRTADLRKPLVGWVSGVDLTDLRAGHAQVVDGRSRAFLDDAAVAAHVELLPDKVPRVSIINPFHPMPGDVLQFTDGGFSAVEVLVNGVPTRLADYLVERGYSNGRLPLVGEYAGGRANVSIQSIERTTGRVYFYAPVFPDVMYRLAAPVLDYAKMIRYGLGHRATAPVAFSCNCILNYVYAHLEGKRLGNALGPVTFGEIANQLLNQTLVVLEID